MAAETALLDLVTPTQGTLTGSWGNTVNNGITEYVDIAIAGTLSLTGDGAVDLVNSIGNAGGTNIVSTLSGAGSVTAQFAVVNISGTTTTKTVTGPSTSKTYIVDNAGSYTVTFKASGQPGVSVVAGEKCTVYYNGSDYVKVASTVVSGTVPVANGGTGLTAGTSGGILAYTATGTLASSAALTANKVVIGGGAGVVPSTTTLLGTTTAVTSGNYIQAVGYADTVTALGNTGTAINLDVTSGNVFSATLTGNAVITLRYPVATGSSSFTLVLTNDATAGRTVSWAGGSFLWPGGAASLSRTTTANATDIWFFFTNNGGTTWYGNISLKNMIA